jgi:murein DD-endopeptidase MepM/ murein hydrolase activator NlpD
MSKLCLKIGDTECLERLIFKYSLMKKLLLNILLAGAVITVAILFITGILKSPKNQPSQTVPIEKSQNNPSSNPPSNSSVAAPENNPPSTVQNNNIFTPPLPRAGNRVTKKPFGIYITPQNSPVQPERFQGFHTGADFEIYPEELNANVSVSAICSGKLILKEYASGYGGVAVESCTLNGSPITVIYGHLKLASISLKTGASLGQGDQIGILGAAYSQETNGERKHLHLGIHKGSSINILGYVQSQGALSGWIDPCLFICHN